jgi:tetratricopeptide (TPR) repeat protein
LGGEAFLAVGQAEKAAELFEQSLLRMPNRPLSLLGAARSYKEMDNAGKASEKYAALLAVWSDDSHPAVQEAKKYLNY